MRAALSGERIGVERLKRLLGQSRGPGGGVTVSKYEKSSETYDAVYLSKKDYVKEAEQVHGIVQQL
jgi:hypothetical protein